MMFLVLLWASVPNVVASIHVQNVLLHSEVFLFTKTWCNDHLTLASLAIFR